MKRQSAPVVQECSPVPQKWFRTTKKDIVSVSAFEWSYFTYYGGSIFPSLYTIHLRRITQRDGIAHQRADLACRTAEFKWWRLVEYKCYIATAGVDRYSQSSSPCQMRRYTTFEPSISIQIMHPQHSSRIVYSVHCTVWWVKHLVAICHSFWFIFHGWYGLESAGIWIEAGWQMVCSPWGDLSF